MAAIRAAEVYIKVITVDSNRSYKEGIIQFVHLSERYNILYMPATCLLVFVCQNLKYPKISLQFSSWNDFVFFVLQFYWLNICNGRD